MRSTIASAIATSIVASRVTAQVTQQCFGQNACFSLNIPQNTANSGSGDVFFQISGPSQYQYIALGQGSSMSGSNIFVMYTSTDGNNVTVSPRLGTGHVQPQHDDTAQITLLEGSGISNGMMTANVRCSNCNSWSGGSMDFSGNSGSWIWAAKAGSSLDSDDLSESISRHDQEGTFSFDFTSARGGTAVNPFVTSSSSTSSGSTSTSGPGSGSDDGDGDGADSSSSGHGGPWGGSGSHGGGDGGANGGNGSGSGFDRSSIPFGGDFQKANRIFIAHGVLASLAFVLLFPIGGILIRVASFTGCIWVHAAIQAIAYLIYIAAFGLGIYMATQIDKLNNHHPIIGIIVFIILFFQPITGWIHHKLFKKYQGRTFWSYEHIGIGRIAIILGIINGGLGLRLAGNASTGQLAAYGVIAGVFGVAYIAAIIYGETKRRRQAPGVYSRREKNGGSPGSSTMEQGSPPQYR
ncbi:iron reductase domain protein [Polychaeton citri CBS 116435]|uniref:Iron reductase domain protein n=1 Tax=Polychaeton citri CBS 116435 TaxID=1314669 RepID=A0A9P4Q2W7_9PEZI|nr:iron reductase domain protein [Polychaeton citri CBS 116435]